MVAVHDRRLGLNKYERRLFTVVRVNDQRGSTIHVDGREGWTHTACQRRGMRTILSAASYGKSAVSRGVYFETEMPSRLPETNVEIQRSRRDRERPGETGQDGLASAAVWFYLRRASSPWRWREEDVSLRETTSHHPENLPRCASSKWNFSPGILSLGGTGTTKKKRDRENCLPARSRELRNFSRDENGVVQAGQILERNTVVERSFRQRVELSGNSDEQSVDLLSGIALDWDFS